MRLLAGIGLHVVAPHNMTLLIRDENPEFWTPAKLWLGTEHKKLAQNKDSNRFKVLDDNDKGPITSGAVRVTPRGI